jgi:hypothetical protein
MKPLMELVDLAVQLVVAVEMRFKHDFACWRPADLSAQVQPMITTPEHGAFPAGHAAQAYAVAIVLEKLLGLASQDKRAVQLQRIAARISINRVVAGVHFPVDLSAGRVLGLALGEYFLARCLPQRQAWSAQSFLSEQDPEFGSGDFQPVIPRPAPQAAPTLRTARGSGLLEEMWREARKCCCDNGYLSGDRDYPEALIAVGR